MEDFWDEFLGLWWGKILMGIGLLGAAALMFYVFSSPEEHNGRVRWYVALAYYIGGKWTVSVLFAVPGLILVWAGISQLRTGEE